MSKISKQYKYSLWGFGLLVLVGLFLPSAHQGEMEPTAKLWLFSIAVYIPFYVVYSQKKGEIALMPRKVTKKENPIIFRLAQFCYLVFSVSVLITLAVKST